LEGLKSSGKEGIVTALWFRKASMGAVTNDMVVAKSTMNRMELAIKPTKSSVLTSTTTSQIQ
jgi:hypothetical protein